MPLDAYGRDRARDDAAIRLLPVNNTGWQSISASVRFGPFVPGDQVIISISAAAHVNAGNSAVTAGTTNPQLPAGIHDFVVPDGCTHVAINGNGSGSGAIWK